MQAVLATFVQLLITVYLLLILARVLLSWTNPMGGLGGGSGLTAFVYQATEPILAPIRRVLPPTGGVDWSPLIAMFILGALRQIVVGLLRF